MTYMAKPVKKKKAARKKASAGKVPKKSRQPAKKAVTAKKPVAKENAAGKNAAKRPVAKKRAAGKTTTVKTGTARKSASPREKLIAVRPSGGKDDSFFDLVHEVVRQIPKGRVTSYGAIGAALGTRSSARMVGWAMNACHLSLKPVPAHRVVNSVGLLTGRHHFKPPEKMQLLLEAEGVAVENNKVVNFRQLFWDPSKEL